MHLRACVPRTRQAAAFVNSSPRLPGVAALQRPAEGEIRDRVHVIPVRVGVTARVRKCRSVSGGPQAPCCLPMRMRALWRPDLLRSQPDHRQSRARPGSAVAAQGSVDRQPLSEGTWPGFLQAALGPQLRGRDRLDALADRSYIPFLCQTTWEYGSLAVCGCLGACDASTRRRDVQPICRCRTWRRSGRAGRPAGSGR